MESVTKYRYDLERRLAYFMIRLNYPPLSDVLLWTCLLSIMNSEIISWLPLSDLMNDPSFADGPHPAK